MDSRSVRLALVASLGVCFTIEIHCRPKEAEAFNLQGQSASSGMVSCSAFMRFSHDETRFFAVDAFQEYFGCGPSVKVSIQDDVVIASCFESSRYLLLRR